LVKFSDMLHPSSRPLLLNTVPNFFT